MITQYTEPKTSEEIKIVTQTVANKTILSIYHNSIQKINIQIDMPETLIHTEIRDIISKLDIQINQELSSIIGE